MVQKINPPKQAGYYISQLGLQWPIEWYLSDQKTTMTVHSDEDKGLHAITLLTKKTSGSRRVKQERNIPDMVHELCHAALAERIGVAFSGTQLTKGYNISRTWVRQRATGLYYAKSLEDIWVNDLRNEIHAKLTTTDLQSNSAVVSALARRAPQHLDTRQFHVGMAQIIGQIKRHKVNVSNTVEKIVEKLPEVSYSLITRLANFYANLPTLSYDRGPDLALLARSVQEAAVILRLNFTPTMVFVKNKVRWKID